MYNISLNNNIIPHTWKLVNIIPNLKPNKDMNIGTSYTPILFLSVIVKTLEKPLLPYITNNIPHISTQHGFKSNPLLVFTIWSAPASDTNINKLQITQNTALRKATECTTDTNTQHLHDETHNLPIREHLQLHTSQIRQKSQQPKHPLHYITTQQTTPRHNKQTTYNNTDYRMCT